MSLEKNVELSKTEWMEKLEGVHLSRIDMNRIVMNYLVTEGYKEAAEKFALETGTKTPPNLQSLDERIKIRDAIQSGKMLDAIYLINKIHPELLDIDRNLFFHLQQQQFIELIRERRIEEALQFAQDQLSERGEENQLILSELERTLALLAFDNPEQSPFSDLLQISHRQRVASEVNAAILKAEHQEQTVPQLVGLMKTILWAQDELDKKKVKYPKLVDCAGAVLEDSKP
uniref:EOG090X0CTI n=1 Tax=Lynceus sp. MCZ IZ 141354 TaxID=1930659 RepID=A0A9N6ZER3_9CRUS|nr:EOG090X0CTI [Lynceus sp. MCZ IZ 141354]